MAKDLPLDERIIAALSKPCTSADAAAVLKDAEAYFADLEARADAADAASLSPLATRAQAGALRGEANELRFESDRMDASVSALRVRVSELRDAEAAAVRKSEKDSALAERDELAGEIAETYPRIVHELTALVQRIEASDERCARSGINESAEAIGRGVPAHWYDVGPIARLASIKLPMPKGGHFAWGYGGEWGSTRAYPGLTVGTSEKGAQ